MGSALTGSRQESVSCVSKLPCGLTAAKEVGSLLNVLQPVKQCILLEQPPWKPLKNIQNCRSCLKCRESFMNQEVHPGHCLASNCK